MLYAILFSTLCFCLSAIGASIVFFMKKGSKNLECFLHAFASGVMMASGIFSLIIPAIEYSVSLNMPTYIILPACFLFAGIISFSLEVFNNQKNGEQFNRHMLVMGIGLHNIPEGMCVGFAFASASILGTQAAFLSAVMIAVGIGIQNIPEGSAVSFPLYSSGLSKSKSFVIALLTGLIEVPSAIIAYLIGLKYVSILPYALAFSAGTMMAVAMTDLMPEAVKRSKKWSIISLFLGFIIMMVLDLALG